MFPDPAVVTVNAVAKNLVRIRQDDYSSEYSLRSATDDLRLTIKNTTYRDKKRNVDIDRHTVQITQTVFPVAPATLSTIRKTYVVIENQVGDTIADTGYLARAVMDFLTNARITQLTNFES